MKKISVPVLANLKNLSVKEKAKNSFKRSEERRVGKEC